MRRKPRTTGQFGHYSLFTKACNLLLHLCLHPQQGHSAYLLPAQTAGKDEGERREIKEELRGTWSEPQSLAVQTGTLQHICFECSQS